MIETILIYISVFLVFIIAASLSWIITCGIVKLITMCFGLTFNWAIATGIWLIMVLLKDIFNSKSKINEEKNYGE